MKRGILAAAVAMVVVMATGCTAVSDDQGVEEPVPHPNGVPSDDVEQNARRWNEEMFDRARSAKTVTPSTYGAGGSPSNPPPPFKTAVSHTCHPIVDGTNSVTVNGKTRKFDVKLPTNRSAKAALLFEWHGFLQSSATFMNEVVYDPPAGKWKAFDPNAFNVPLITIAPHDSNLIPIWGLDWDIVSGERDFPYFETILTCIEEQFSVDTTRVYSMGFSAGAVFTNLLVAAYPKLFAATMSISGQWYNDRSQWSDIIVPGVGTVFMKWKWPALDPADGGAVLVTHGGPNDFATVANLETASIKAMTFLYAAGRDVTECTHQFGHTLAPDLTQAMFYQFMWDNQLGGPRPKALTAGMPDGLRPLFSTKCNHRPVRPAAPKGVNGLVNPGFEVPGANWSCTGGCGFDDAAVKLSRTGIGNGWVRSNRGWNDIHQIFTVTPNTNYRVSGWIRTSPNHRLGFFGLRTATGQVVGEQSFGSLPGFTQLNVTVNSGPNTTLVVYGGLWADNGDTSMQIDDVSVVAQ